jgi:hypothetical protein
MVRSLHPLSQGTYTRPSAAQRPIGRALPIQKKTTSHGLLHRRSNERTGEIQSNPLTDPSKKITHHRSSRFSCTVLRQPAITMRWLRLHDRRRAAKIHGRLHECFTTPMGQGKHPSSQLLASRQALFMSPVNRRTKPSFGQAFTRHFLFTSPQIQGAHPSAEVANNLFWMFTSPQIRGANPSFGEEQMRATMFTRPLNRGTKPSICCVVDRAYLFTSPPKSRDKTF